MPGLPAEKEDAVGAVPEVPDNTITEEAGGRHSGCVAVGDGVRAGVLVAVPVLLTVRNCDDKGVPDIVESGVPLMV